MRGNVIDLFQQISSIPGIQYIGVLPALYSLALSLFRHSVYEDNGVLSSILEVVVNALPMIGHYAIQDTKYPALFTSFLFIDVLLVLRSYVTMVSGPAFVQNDMKGKTIIITGANSGIGYETALSLAKLRATVILGCRSRARAEGARKNIVKEAGCPDENVQPFYHIRSLYRNIFLHRGGYFA